MVAAAWSPVDRQAGRFVEVGGRGTRTHVLERVEVLAEQAAGAAVVEGMVEVGEEKCSEHVCVVIRKD